MFLYLDTETTGLSAKNGDKIVEIAIVDQYNNILLNTLVNPERLIPRYAQEVHHITDFMVHKFPKIEDILDQILSIIDGNDLVIYNANFDIQFFSNKLSNASSVRCAMNEYKRKTGSSKKCKLSVAAENVGHVWSGEAHRALADTFACKSVWEWICADSVTFRPSIARITDKTEYKGFIDEREEISVFYEHDNFRERIKDEPKIIHPRIPTPETEFVNGFSPNPNGKKIIHGKIGHVSIQNRRVEKQDVYPASVAPDFTQKRGTGSQVFYIILGILFLFFMLSKTNPKKLEISSSSTQRDSLELRPDSNTIVLDLQDSSTSPSNPDSSSSDNSIDISSIEPGINDNLLNYSAINIDNPPTKPEINQIQSNSFDQSYAVNDTPTSPKPIRTSAPKIDIERLSIADQKLIRKGKLAVSFSILVGINGRVLDAIVLRPSGSEAVDKELEDHIRARWRFEPQKRSGQPEEAWVPATINF
jgi:TonB family protein